MITAKRITVVAFGSPILRFRSNDEPILAVIDQAGRLHIKALNGAGEVHMAIFEKGQWSVVADTDLIELATQNG